MRRDRQVGDRGGVRSPCPVGGDSLGRCELGDATNPPLGVLVASAGGHRLGEPVNVAGGAVVDDGDASHR